LFTLLLPVRYAAMTVPELSAEPAMEVPRMPVLAVDDDAQSQLMYEQMARGSSYVMVPARSLRQGREALGRFRPAAIIMDVKLGIESSWAWLGELKSSPETAHLPVIVSTHSDDPRKSYALGADAYLDKPISRAAFLRALNEVTRSRILLIDDDPASRYAIRKMLDAGKYHVLEAADAEEGLRIANTMQPHLVFLDLNLPDRRGELLLEELITGELTKDIPVVIATSQLLNASERERLGHRAAAVVQKGELGKESVKRLLEVIRESPVLAT